MNKFKILKIKKEDNYGYKYNIQTFTKAENNKYYYCGNGRFCKNIFEVLKFIKNNIK